MHVIYSKCQGFYHFTNSYEEILRKIILNICNLFRMSGFLPFHYHRNSYLSAVSTLKGHSADIPSPSVRHCLRLRFCMCLTVEKLVSSRCRMTMTEVSEAEPTPGKTL